MQTLLQKFKAEQERNIPDLRPGDTVKVHQKIKEGAKERIQIFEGVIIARKNGKGIAGTMTVRKVIEGVGVERIFPIHSPSIEKVEVVSHGKVRRAKLNYLRTAKGKKSILKRKEFSAAIAPEAASEETSLATEEREPKVETPVKEQTDEVVNNEKEAV